MNDELKLIQQKMLMLAEDPNVSGPHVQAVDLLIEAIRLVARRQGCVTSFLLDEIAATYAKVPRWYE